MLRPWILTLAFGASSAALAGPLCAIDLPASWSAEPTRGQALRVAREPQSQVRDVQGAVTLRAPAHILLQAAVEKAKAEELASLQGHPDVELVRDEALPGGRVPGHLLVFHYRLPSGRWFGLRYHALVETPRGVADVIADSRAVYIDAMHHKNFEAGAHEREIITAILSTRCAL